jgi:L-fuconolactonase
VRCACAVGDRPPFDDVWPHVLRVVEAFGVDRLVWASDISRFQRRTSWDWAGRAARDYPFAHVGMHTYADAVELYRSTTRLSAAEKAQLLGGTLRRLLRWGGRPHS